MRVAIIGGKLQGVEAAYLASKAGWDTLLIDRNEFVPATGLCNETVQVDISDSDRVVDLLTDVDLVIPAFENRSGLEQLERLADRINCPVAFDFKANALSSSKAKSHTLFAELGLSMPLPYPDCGFPLLVKPDNSSGSEGVTILENEADCIQLFGQNTIPGDWVGQQFVSGSSYSLEVIGSKEQYCTPQITELHMDSGYDCKAVTAPAEISRERAAELQSITLELAAALDLNGIMDVEVIQQGDNLYLLEIDARLPSQTPIAVYWSSGQNLLEMLADQFVPLYHTHSPRTQEKWIRLEHIRVEEGVLTLAGEHLMASASSLHIETDFFGADEAITDYQPGSNNWCATLIHTGKSFAELKTKQMVALAAIKASNNIHKVIDSEPAAYQNLKEADHDTVKIC